MNFEVSMNSGLPPPRRPPRPPPPNERRGPDDEPPKDFRGPPNEEPPPNDRRGADEYDEEDDEDELPPNDRRGADDAPLLAPYDGAERVNVLRGALDDPAPDDAGLLAPNFRGPAPREGSARNEPEKELRPPLPREEDGLECCIGICIMLLWSDPDTKFGQAK